MPLKTIVSRATNSTSDDGTIGSPLRYRWRNCHGRGWPYGYNLDAMDHLVAGNSFGGAWVFSNLFSVHCKKVLRVGWFADWLID